jgi:hypothetical protein
MMIMVGWLIPNSLESPLSAPIIIVTPKPYPGT